MKKFAAIVLVLVLSIMFTTAFATEMTFAMQGVTDMEGNTLYVVLEDQTVVDVEENPVEGIPFIMLTVDDEAQTFTMGTADQAVNGTIEVVESDDTQVTLQLIPEEGNVITAIYTTEGVRAITAIDEANGMMIVFVEAEAA